ncbi:MAG: hypothetical protein H7A38_05845 [Chlamydiales bacterium]|nr:hypothetical protein [Chlamydiales bacterium]
MAALPGSYESFQTYPTSFFEEIKSDVVETFSNIVEGITQVAGAFFSSIERTYEAFQAADQKLYQQIVSFLDGILEKTRSAFKGAQDERAPSGYVFFDVEIQTQ